MKAITLYIGLDVHQDSIVIAIAESDRNGEILLFGTITNAIRSGLGRPANACRFYAGE